MERLGNVVSKMLKQVQRRRQQVNRGKQDSSEEGLREMQTQLSDIGSIRDIQAHRAETEAQAKTKAQRKATSENDEEYMGG